MLGNAGRPPSKLHSRSPVRGFAGWERFRQMVVIPAWNRCRIRVKAMNQMRVVRSLGAAVPDVRRARGAVGSCWRLGARPAAMTAAAGPITGPYVNFPHLADRVKSPGTLISSDRQFCYHLGHA